MAETLITIEIKKLIVPIVVMLVFWTLAALMWLLSGEILALFFFGYIDASIGLGLGMYAALPRKKKPVGRRLSLLMRGTPVDLVPLDSNPLDDVVHVRQRIGVL